MTRSTFAIREAYYTVQGEAGQSGRAAVFLRFAGCNLWSGREHSRMAAVCRFCDTDFVGVDGPGGGRFTAEALARHVREVFPAGGRHDRLIVMTGGEPTLQVTRALVRRLRWETGATVAIETNGTGKVPWGVDWITVSPKGTALDRVVQRSGAEVKLVYPQADCTPEDVRAKARADRWFFPRWFLQPMEVPDRDEWAANTAATIDYVKAHPWWRLSVQSHKLVGIP